MKNIIEKEKRFFISHSVKSDGGLEAGCYETSRNHPFQLLIVNNKFFLCLCFCLRISFLSLSCGLMSQNKIFLETEGTNLRIAFHFPIHHLKIGEMTKSFATETSLLSDGVLDKKDSLPKRLPDILSLPLSPVNNCPDFLFLLPIHPRIHLGAWIISSTQNLDLNWASQIYRRESRKKTENNRGLEVLFIT